MIAMPSISPPTSFTRRVLIVVGLALLGVLALLLVWFGFRLLLVIFGGLLFGVLLNGLTHLLQHRTSLSYGWSFGIVVIVLVGLLGFLGWLIGGQIASQADELAQKIPEAIQALTASIREFTWGEWLLSNLPSFEEASQTSSDAQNSGSNGGGTAQPLARFFAATLGSLTNLVVALLIGIYAALHRKLYAKGLLHLVPSRQKERAKEVLHAVIHALRWWFVGRFASMAAVGALTAVGLMILGVPLALTLGLLAAAFSFVPYVGPLFSFVPAILMGYLESPQTALYVLGLMMLVQFLESYLITPLIQKRAVSIAPVLLISAQLLMGTAAGILGVLVATPFTVMVVVLVQLLYVEDMLGDRDVEVLGE